MHWITILVTRHTFWLLSGLLVGAALALLGLLRAAEPPALPDDSVARVGATVISRADYARALQAAASNRREPLDAAARQHVLDQLINEALLVADGQAMDLVTHAPRLRDVLVDEVLEMLRQRAAAEPVTEADLREHLAAHPQRFAGSPQLHVVVASCATRAAADRAGETLVGDGSALPATCQVLPAPDRLVPADSLDDYLGASLTAAASRQPVDRVNAPIPVGNRHAVMVVRDRRDPSTPALDAVRGAVEQSLRRQRAEAVLGAHLDMLRDRFDVTVADDLR